MIKTDKKRLQYMSCWLGSYFLSCLVGMNVLCGDAFLRALLDDGSAKYASLLLFADDVQDT